MEKSSTYVGLDVHKDTIDVSLAEADRTGELRHYGKIPSDLRSVDCLIGYLTKPGLVLRVVYEAGPTGFALYRPYQLRIVTGVTIPAALGHR